MKKVFISKNYRDPFTASSKAKMDCETIVNKIGFKNIGLKAKSFDSTLLGRIWTTISFYSGFLKMPYNGVVFLQYPTNYIKSLIDRAKHRNNKVIVLLHDINSIRCGKNPDEELAFLNKVDCVIVHTDSMARVIHEIFPEIHIEVLGIFDYLDGTKSDAEELSDYSIAFAGNLSKSKFITYLHGLNLNFNLFGIKDNSLVTSDKIQYKGCFHPSELGKNLKSSFGLVWDGNSIDRCDGILGEYLKLISPHKLSMYITSGIPVIIWNDSAMASFVRDNSIGLAISSLKDLESLFRNISSREYAVMKQNTLKIAHNLSTGYYLTSAIERYLNSAVSQSTND